MAAYFKKKIVLPLIAAGVFYLGSSFKDDFFEVAKQLEIFTTLFKAVNTNYVDETSPADLMDKAIKSMLTTLDPYTVFFNEQDVINFKINNTGEYTGIGALITRKKDRIIVREPYKNYPADKAGLKAGDEIIQIGDILLSDYKDDTSQLLKGAKNTKIPIKYIRQDKTQTTTLILDEVEIKSVPFYGKIDAKTGYIVLAHFSQKASFEVKEAVIKLKEDGISQLILDLRGNPGGLLHEAVAICNLFVAKNETIVSTKSRIDKHNNVYKTNQQPIDTEIPLIILINGKSASASEIVAGALQDLDRAVVMGSRSFGKGLVQRSVDLTYGTQLKVTISKYFTPSGRCIQALDYKNKDANGLAIKTDAKNYTAFKTRKGRTVYDGGGVAPDIELEESNSSPIANALVKNDGIFNFATHYYFTAKPQINNEITISDKDYETFKSYLKNNKYSFDTATDLALKNTLAAATRENLNEAIQPEYQQLLKALEKSETILLDKHKIEIKNLILEELIRRYQYQEGLYKYYLSHNTEINKATDVLNTMSTYKAILKIN